MTYLVSPVINRQEHKPRRFKGKRKTYRFVESVLEQHNLQVETIVKKSDIEELICSQYGSRIFVKPVQ